jgi:hypothetical protein
VGTHTISATYEGGGADFGVSTATLIQTVHQANTTTMITTSVDPSVHGQEVTFTATVAAVAPGAGIPAGTVQFSVGGDFLGGPVTLVKGVATLATSALPVGPRRITAAYSGEANFLASGGTLSQGVLEAGSTTALFSSANPSGLGQQISFTAAVSAVAPGTGTPVGTVQFSVDGAPLGGPVNLVNGEAASAFTSGLTLGAHTVTATYSGDGNFAGSSAMLTQTVANGTTTTITSSANPSTSGQQVTFTATVTPVVAGAGTPSGTVQFRSGGDFLGGPVTLVNGVATAPPTSFLGPTSPTITATYSGDTNFAASSGSLTQTVN